MKNNGLYDKYSVINCSTGAKVDNCFVLELKDPVARKALDFYAKEIYGINIELCMDIWEWLINYEELNING